MNSHRTIAFLSEFFWRELIIDGKTWAILQNIKTHICEDFHHREVYSLAKLILNFKR